MSENSPFEKKDRNKDEKIGELIVRLNKEIDKIEKRQKKMSSHRRDYRVLIKRKKELKKKRLLLLSKLKGEEKIECGKPVAKRNIDFEKIIPLKYFHNTEIIKKNGEFHIFLASGKRKENNTFENPNHGHIVITAEDKIRYCRYPDEPHGKINHIIPPVSLEQFLNGEYANYEKIIIRNRKT